MTYIAMAVKYSILNPLHFINYLFKSSTMTWDIIRDADWKGKPYYDITADGARTSFFNHNKSTPTTSYENASLTHFGTNEFNQLDSIVDLAKDNIILDTLFNSPALYMYLSFILMAGAYLLLKSKESILVYLPNLLNILIVFLSTPIQDNRYLYPNLLVFYLLVMIMIGIIYNLKNKNSPNLIQKYQINNKQHDFTASNNTKTYPIKKETPEEMEARIRAEIIKELEDKDIN